MPHSGRSVDSFQDLLRVNYKERTEQNGHYTIICRLFTG